MEKIEAVKTKLTLDDAIDAFWSGLIVLLGFVPSAETLSILVAQSALETGNWHSAYCYNFGNARPDAHTEFYCQFPCGEFVNGKQEKYSPPDPRTDFRAFKTAAAGMLDHLYMLQSHWPEAWNAALGGELAQFVHLLKLQPEREEKNRRGYFTAPVIPYIRGVAQLQAQYLPICAEFRNRKLEEVRRAGPEFAKRDPWSSVDSDARDTEPPSAATVDAADSWANVDLAPEHQVERAPGAVTPAPDGVGLAVLKTITDAPAGGVVPPIDQTDGPA